MLNICLQPGLEMLKMTEKRMSQKWCSQGWQTENIMYYVFCMYYTVTTESDGLVHFENQCIYLFIGT